MVFSIMVGINAAQETLTSQAFGAGELRLCGIYLNRGQIILLTAYCIFASVPVFFGEQIFYAITQDEEVSVGAQHIVRCYIPCQVMGISYDLWKRWMAC